MSHPESEHSLMIEVARLQQDLREARAQIGKERDAWVAANARADAAEAELAKHEGCIADNAKAFDESLGQCLDRAEKAEAELRKTRLERSDFKALNERALERLFETQETMVVARLGLKAAHEYCLYMFKREWLTDPRNRSIFAAHIFAILDAALAAPASASGEEGADKRRGGKPEISMQDVLDNMIDDLSTP